MPKGVTAPKYARSDLKAGLFHIGVGNFHRAHQAVYLDELFNLGLSRDWAIVGTGVRAADAAMHSALEAQDWLTTVVEQEAHFSSAHVTAAMIDFVAPTTPDERLAKICESASGFIYIVSTTGTTGERKELPPELRDLAARTREASPIPTAVGFGISTPEQAAEVGQIADGVIIGSRLVRAVDEAGSPDAAANAASGFLTEVRDALTR